MALTREQQDQIAQLLAVKDKVEEEYLRRPGVTGIGVGFKTVGGRSTDRLAICFYVERKRSDLPPEEVLPTTIAGFPTDVEQASFRPLTLDEPPACLEAKPDDEKYTPLVGGISISVKAAGGAGTLGVMVKGPDDEDMMLSNYHVMFGSGGQGLGEDVCQPAYASTRIGWCSNCAVVKAGLLGNVDGVGIDAAIAKRDHREAVRGFVFDIGLVNAPVDPQLQDRVKKRGRKTLLTTGAISSVGVTTTNGLRNQFLVRGDDGRPFACQGDSGSLVVREEDRAAVGLLWGVSASSQVVPCAVSPIKTVLAALGVELF